MKKKHVLTIMLGALLQTSIFAAWSPKGDKIRTVWAEKVTPENVWRSYPRPQLQRSQWMNLNGLWKFAVTDQATTKKQVKYEGEILVPFAIESSLSGVQRTFLPTDKLWYQHNFTIDEDWKGKNIILHFQAVDYECQVWVNNKLAGTHKGGNNPFEFDITKFINKSGDQMVELSVVDPTDQESISRGKQQLNQKGIWYTPVSGIWQTVWLEAVNPQYIRQILPEADIHKKTVKLHLDVAGAKGQENIKVEVLDKRKVIKTIEQKGTTDMEIEIPDAVLWTPASPQLYHLNVELSVNGKIVDNVKSYFTLREAGIKKDACGYNRICLNGEPIFQFGTLDQGWWPDGLLTPPSEEAMLWDMVQLKEMGFNTIRKHIKVEPEQYYYYADSLGLMLWQDMVSGFSTERKQAEHVAAGAANDWNAPAEHSAQWQKEMFEMIDRLRFYSCITTWVVFNEGWGQHNTAEIVNKVMSYDKSRIIDGVTGWADRGVGHMYDVHNYPVSSMILPEYNGDRISVLGEFGGYGWAIKEHLWNPEMRNWGYKNIDGAMALMDNYGRVIHDLKTLVAQGLSAAIYTQTTDVEGEVNGLLTYDRKVTKMPTSLLHILHNDLYNVAPAKAITLVPDGQGGAKNQRKVSVNGSEMKQVMLPYSVQPKATVVSETEFVLGQPLKNLSLWLRAAGTGKVWLNGVEVFLQDIRMTKQYNQYNLSDYSSLLKKGKNTIKIEVQGTNKMDFDYGLRAF